METMVTTMDIMGKRLSSSVGPAESPMPRQTLMLKLMLMLMLVPILTHTSAFTDIHMADIMVGTPTASSARGLLRLS